MKKFALLIFMSTIILGLTSRSVKAQTTRVVARVWQGKVAEARADEYEEYHFGAGVKKMQGIKGMLGIEVLRRTENGATEFTTISYWESRDAIRQFAGEDIEKPHHLPKDPEYLLELPTQVRHYEVAYSDLGKLVQNESHSKPM
jgi:heme-degrading monooxygenase HmoA